MAATNLLQEIAQEQCKPSIPDFRTGDTLRVHTRILEGNKERIQVFEGIVLKRPKSFKNPSSTFTVRKVSYNIGVERTFFVHSPRIEKIEIVKRGVVRRARLFYLRERRGKSARIRSQLHFDKSAIKEIATGNPASEKQSEAQEATE
jgi:large subunit ribosomal protein L19